MKSSGSLAVPEAGARTGVKISRAKVEVKMEEPPASEEWIEGMAVAMSMLANSKRMAILYYLLEKDLSVSDLVRLSGGSFPAISQQLKLLTLTGILERRREGRNIYYSLVDKNVHSILDLLRTFEPRRGNRIGEGAL